MIGGYSKFIDAAEKFSSKTEINKYDSLEIARDMILCVISCTQLNVKKEIKDYNLPDNVIFNHDFNIGGKNTSKILLRSELNYEWVGSLDIYSPAAKEVSEKLNFSLSIKDLKNGMLKFHNLDFTGSSSNFKLFCDDFVEYSINEVYPILFHDANEVNDYNLPVLYKKLISYKEKFVISLAKFSCSFLSPFDKLLVKTFNYLTSGEMFYANLVNNQDDTYAISISCFLDSNDSWNQNCVQITIHKTSTINKNFILFSKKIIERKEILQFNLKYNSSNSWENIVESLDYTIISPEYLEDCINALSTNDYSIIQTNLISLSNSPYRNKIDEDRKIIFMNYWKQ